MDQVYYNFLLVIMEPLKQPVPLNFFKVPKNNLSLRRTTYSHNLSCRSCIKLPAFF